MATRGTPESHIARALRTALEPLATGADISELAETRDVLDGLEYFLPSVLAEIYPYWKGESLDGFYLSEARKIGIGKAELRGLCILISDQTLSPFHIRLKVSPAEDLIDWMECKLGKRGSGKGSMERIPYFRWQNHSHLKLQDSLKAIEWTYQASYGQEEAVG